MRTTLLLLAASGSALALAAQDEPPRTNVVLILADDLGYADLSLHGSEQVATPHIDAIARAGARCTQAYAASAICGPSRAAILTGRYPQRFGFESNVYKFRPGLERGRYAVQGLGARERTLPELLRGAGYRTGLIGKWHLGWGGRHHPDQHGFEHFYGFLAGSRAYRPRPEAPADECLLLGRERAPEEFEYLTDELGAAAARFVEAHAAEPFFLQLSFSAVHGPMQAPADRLAAHEDVEPMRRRKLVAMTEAMDAAVGRVLAALDEHELAQHTLVVFTSDHGGSDKNAADNAPLRAGKGAQYEGGVRVPLFLRWPGRIEAGTLLEGPVSLLDLVPTALAAADVQPSNLRLDGVDLAPYLAGEEESAPHEALFWRRLDASAARVGDLKLVLSPGNDPELYDLSSDPGEEHDLADAHPERVAELRARHESWSSTLRTPLWGRYREEDD